MADYKYINAGRLGLLDTLNKSGTQYTENYTYNPVSGLSFTNTNTYSRHKLPTGKEFWMKFKMYQTRTNLSFHDDFIGFYGASEKATISADEVKDNTVMYAIYYTASKYTENVFELLKKTPIDIEMHVKSDATAGIFEIFANNVMIHTYTGNVMNGADILYAGIYDTLSRGGIIFSDIIIQNTGRIGMEHVIEIPVKATTATGWTANTDGSYTTETTGASLLQTIDVDALKTKIGATSNLAVKSIAVAGYPAYYNADGELNAMKTIVKSGDTTQEIETVTLGSLSTDCMLTTPIAKNPITAMAWTVDDLSNIAVGVKTATQGG